MKLDYGLVKLDSMISSSLSNELRVQYGRELDWEGQQPHSNFTSTYLNNTTNTPVQLAIYGGSTNHGFTAGMPYYSFRTAYPEEKKTQVGDTAIWTHHGHTISSASTSCATPTPSTISMRAMACTPTCTSLISSPTF